MKICYVTPMAEVTSGAWLQLVQKVFPPLVRRENRIDITFISPGIERAADYDVAYFQLANKLQIVEKVIEAERDGYDACVIGCFHDLAVREARQMVDIPVVGPMESSLLYACTLGRKFGIVTVGMPKQMPEFENEVRSLRLEGRGIPRVIRPIRMTAREVFTDGMENPQLITDAIMEQARECISEGADVIVIGCCGLGPAATLLGISVVPGLDVPVLDCAAVAIKSAEFAAEMRHVLRLPAVSRLDTYSRPREKDVSRVRSMFGMKALPSPERTK